MKQLFGVLLCGLLFVFMLSPASAQEEEYVAYSLNESGERAPLPEEIENMDDVHLFNVEWGPYQGNQSRIGILPVANETQHSAVRISERRNGERRNIDVEGFARGVPVNEIEAMFTDIIHRTDRFRVLERSRIDSAMQEQDLGASGRVTNESAAQVGNLLGAEYLIQGVVTHYEPEVEAQQFGIGALFDEGVLGGLFVESATSLVGMNFRMMDAETGEILFTRQVQVELNESGFGFAGGAAGSDVAGGALFSTASETPMGQAIIAALNRGAFSLVKHVGAQPAQGSVVQVQGGQIFINLAGGAVEEGVTLDLISLGEELTDPETGLSLGHVENEIGQIRVVSVRDQFSITTPVDFSLDDAGVESGDRVVSQDVPELRFASEFER